MGKFFYFCISIRDGIKTIMNGDIIIKDTLEQLGTEVANRYIAHVYCYAGTCEVGFNDSCFQIYNARHLYKTCGRQKRIAR